MKKYLLTFALVYFNLFCTAQKYDAKFYFTNGKVSTGKADLVLNGASKVKFKDSETNESERIKFDDLTKVEYYDTSSESPIVFEKKEIIWRKGKKETVWLNKIESAENVSVYVSKTYIDGYSNMTTINTMPPETLTCYFFQYKDQTPEIMYYLRNHQYIKKKKEILGYVEHFFNSICPSLVQEYKNDRITLKENPLPLLEFYKQNCYK